MSEQHENKRAHDKRIEIKNGSFIDKLSEMAEIRARRSKSKGEADPYVLRTPRDYENSKVDYPNVSLLDRPLDMPGPVRRGMLLFLAAAALIGSFFLFRYFDVVVNAPAREAAQVVENTQRTVPYNLPVLLDLMPLTDTEIMAQLKGSGDTLFERTAIGTDPDGGFQVVRLPEGVSIADAAALYLSGLDNVSAAAASRLLNGAWDLTVTREAPSNLFLRYADFASGSIESAIQNALLAEDLEAEDETESGIDESGNTFAAGAISRDGAVYSWRISVIALSEVYSLKGLPEDALYVGIRMTQPTE